MTKSGQEYFRYDNPADQGRVAKELPGAWYQYWDKGRGCQPRYEEHLVCRGWVSAGGDFWRDEA
jgi:hypothetical protein